MRVQGINSRGQVRCQRAQGALCVPNTVRYLESPPSNSVPGVRKRYPQEVFGRRVNPFLLRGLKAGYGRDGIISDEKDINTHDRVDVAEQDGEEEVEHHELP